MSTPVALQVKAYLLPCHGRPNPAFITQCTEIRRFVVVHPWTGIYSELVRKIEASFGDFIKSTPEEPKPALTTYWQDDEAELVGFANDDEMKYANDLLVTLAQSKGHSAPQHVFKVYIGRKHTKPAPEPAIHVGVVCDGCDDNKAIVGDRFKCQTCVDFDLCSMCEARGIHKEHTFTKIETPAGGRRGCPFPGGRRHGPGPHHGPHHHWGPRPHHRQPTAGAAFGDMFANLGQFVPVINNPEELKRLGAHLKTMLEPFGVDVDYFVDNCTKASEKEAEAAAAKAKTAAPAETPEASKQAEAASASATPDVSMTSEEPATSSKPAAEAEKPSFKVPEDPMEEHPFLQVINMMKGFNVAEKEANKDAAASAPSSIEDSFVNLDAEVEKELKIIRAIDQLKAMGYSDDGGWLMRLVVAKDGNINAVLDAIAPK